MRKILLIILFAVSICYPQIKRFALTPLATSADTTTNFYVLSDLHFNQVLADSVNAPTDSVFMMVDLDSAHTIDVNCVITSNDLLNKALVWGADTLTGFTEITGTATAIVDTFYSSQNSDDKTRQYSTGIYDLNYINIGAQGTSNDRAGFKFNNIIERAIFDSAKIEFVAYQTDGSKALKIKFLCEDNLTPSTFSTYSDFDTRFADTTSNNRYVDTTITWSDGTRYKFRIDDPIEEIFGKYTYSGSQSLVVFEGNVNTADGVFVAASSYNYSSQTERPSLIVYSHAEASPSYYKKYITNFVYDIFFGDTHGTLVENKDSVNGAGDWYYDDANDSLYVYSTANGVIAILRNGFNVTSSATIAGLDFQKCNKAIYVSEGTNVTIKQSNFYQNVYGIMDTADGVSHINYNILNNNLNNVYLKDKDTAYVFNNVVFSYLPSYTGETNFVADNSKLILRNNAFAIDNFGDVRVGDIDLESNIISMSNNFYSYDFITDGDNLDQFWLTDVKSYDSLVQFQNDTGLENNGIEIKSWHSKPTNSTSYAWLNNGESGGFYFGNNETVFMPRIDTTVVSPLVGAGYDVGLTKDFNNVSLLEGAPSIGALENFLLSYAEIFIAEMYSNTDSALALFNYVIYQPIDSANLVTTNLSNSFITSYSITDDDSLFFHPDWNESQTSVSVSNLTATEYEGTDSCRISGWFYSGNDTSTYRVSWGISSMTDSSTQFTQFTFVPYEHSIYMEVYSNGNVNPVISTLDTLIHSDSVQFSYTIHSLSTDTTYKVRVTANNSAGWYISDTTTFRIESSWTPSYVYYFSTSGDDLNDGLTSGTPRKTLAKLQAMIDAGLLAGTSIKFKRGDTWTTRGGVYGLDFSNCQGAAGNPIVFESYGTGLKPRFDFTGFADATDIDGANYITLDGLAIWSSDSTWSNIPQYGIGGYGADATEGASNITITNCLIRNVGGGISLLPSGGAISNWTITNDTIWGTWNGLDAEGYTGKGSGISLQLSSYTDRIPNVLIDGTVFIDIGAEPNTDNHEHVLYSHEQSMNWTISNNTMLAITRTHMNGLALAGGSNITITGNTAYNLGYGFVRITARQITGGTIDSVYIYDNTVYDCGNAVTFARISSYATSYINEVKIYNNLFYNLRNRAFQFLLTNNVSNLLIANNTISEYGLYGAVSFEYASVSGSNNRFYNNIFINTENTYPFISTLGRDESDITSAFSAWDNNIYYTTSSAPIASIELGTTVYSTLAAWQTATPFDDNSENSNPNLDGNYKLQVTSTNAINEGHNLSDFTTDFEGGIRSGTWDIGFDEYGVP